MNPTSSPTRRYAPSLQVEQLISKLAQDEAGKRQHYRPIYSLHKWWARRPGALFRAMILLATHPELRETLLQTDAQVNLKPKAPYFCDYNLDDYIILDPFMGGGTTLVEANRMGARTVGCALPAAQVVIGRPRRSGSSVRYSDSNGCPPLCARRRRVRRASWRCSRATSRSRVAPIAVAEVSCI
ncbi:MAG: DUF1156 domain-containing protein [Fimbriimonadales bacterium]